MRRSIGCLLLALLATSSRGQVLLCDFVAAPSYRVESELNTRDDDAGLLLGVDEKRPAIVKLRPDVGSWDCSDYTRLAIDVENLGDEPAYLAVRAYNADGKPWVNSAVGEGFIRPKQRKPFVVYFYRKASDRSKYPALAEFKGMWATPGGFRFGDHVVDPSDLRSLEFELKAGPSVRVRSVRAIEPTIPDALRRKEFFPFVDRFGQYKWADWPGKVKGETQLIAIAQAERADLIAHPPRASWDVYGGWKDGPQLAGSQFFRVEKIDDRWWLVDPEGHLFWSHGVNSVTYDSAGTTILGRANWFADLPPRTGAYTSAWGIDKNGNPKVDHLRANLIRALGPDVDRKLPALTHDRLQSWGLNTIGAWSDATIIAGRRTPYTKIIHPAFPTIRPRVPDVFDPRFEASVREAIRKGVGDAAGDRWCVGFFVDNELMWGNDPLAFVGELFSAPATCASKRVMLEKLRERFATIEELNAAIGTKFPSWALALAWTQPVPAQALAPQKRLVESIFAAMAERYFATCRAALAEAAPGQLYLGGRFHIQSQSLVEAGSKYCDVLSFNRYEHSVAQFDAYGVDKPVLISEFSFGSLDRGMFGAGLTPVSDQADRADQYRFYVDGALRNPKIIGTHWFAYGPQSIAGRSDGENDDIGLFDVCNQPYPELRDAVRATADTMYERRFGK